MTNTNVVICILYLLRFIYGRFYGIFYIMCKRQSSFCSSIHYVFDVFGSDSITCQTFIVLESVWCCSQWRHISVDTQRQTTPLYTCVRERGHVACPWNWSKPRFSISSFSTQRWCDKSNMQSYFANITIFGESERWKEPLAPYRQLNELCYWPPCIIRQFIQTHTHTL